MADQSIFQRPSRRRLVSLVSCLFISLGTLVSVPEQAVAVQGVTTRASLGPSNAEANGASGSPAMSDDGRYIAFDSGADNLVSGDTNNKSDIFVRDMIASTTQLVSVGYDGAPANSWSSGPSISESGRYVAFESMASNLVPDDTNATGDIFVRDLEQGTTVRVSVGASGQGNGSSFRPTISASGTRVAFVSYATNLVSNDTNGQDDIFVRDLETSQTLRASVASDGTQSNSFSWAPAISGDGRYVAFESAATSLHFPDVNNALDIFVHDTQTGTTLLESKNSDGVQGSLASSKPDLSRDGRYLVFRSSSTNLVVNKTSLVWDVFLRDRATGTTSRLSVNEAGQGGNSNSWDPVISSDGAFVVFPSDASNLVTGDTNSHQDVFSIGRIAGTITRVSISSAASEANNPSGQPAISSNGRYFAFASQATNLVSDDQNSLQDVFRHDSGETNPPVILNLQANPSAFSPNGDGVKDTTTISFVASDESPPIEWQVDVLNAVGAVVRGWSGSTGSGDQNSIEWDGNDASGQKVVDGQYTIRVTAVDQWTNSRVQSIQVRVDTLGPSIQDLIPFDGGNTIFPNGQPLLAKITDSGSGVVVASISFELTDVSSGSTSSYGASSFNPSTGWAKTSGIGLSGGHLYRISVLVADNAGNVASKSQESGSTGGGFLSSSLAAVASQADIPETPCHVSNDIDPSTGMKTATCENVPIHLDATQIQVGPTRNMVRGFINHHLDLSQALITSHVAGVPVSLSAYDETDPVWTTQVGVVPFEAEESEISRSVPSAQFNARLKGTFTVKVPATWTEASLFMPSAQTNSYVHACADPTISADPCSPDPFSSRGRSVWAPVSQVRHVEPCDSSVTHLAQAVFEPDQDALLELQIDTTKLSPTRASLYYRLQRGDIEVISIEGSNETYSFTIPGVSLTQDTRIEYYFAVEGVFASSRCATLDSAVSPTNNSFVSLATNAVTSENDELFKTVMDAAVAALEQPFFSISTSALQLCEEYFAPPTPCDIFTGNSQGTPGAFPGGVAQDLFLPTDGMTSGALATNGLTWDGACETGGFDAVVVTDNQSTNSSTPFTKSEAFILRSGAKISSYVETERASFAGTTDAQVKVRVGHVFRVIGGDSSSTIQVRVLMEYGMGGVHYVRAEGGLVPFPPFTVGSGTAKAGVSIGKSVETASSSGGVSPYSGDYPRDVYVTQPDDPTSTSATWFQTDDRKDQEVCCTDADFGWRTISKNTYYYFALAWRIWAQSDVGVGAMAHAEATYSGGGIPAVLFFKIGRIRVETPGGFGACS